MNRKLISFIFITIVFIAQYTNVFAVIKPRPLGEEGRIKVINYRPNQVFHITGHYLYHSIIEFELEETVQTVLMGTPTPWYVEASGNRIYFKPIADDASTNMTVITDKRTYFFEMHATEVENLSDEKVSFIIKFLYPGTGISSIQHVRANKGPDLKKPELYNFEYTLSGESYDIEPLQVFDDGEFTYFKFRDTNAELPAIFLVKFDNSEAMINYRITGDYVVVERVAERFTLRHGSETICVFNEDLLRERERRADD